MVAPVVAAALISGGASILGGMMSNRNNRKNAEIQAQNQREFAQHGIRWKVADAKAAGLHPLYAMSGSSPTYSPTYSSDALGPAIASAGQQVSRAVGQHESMKQEKQLAAAERMLRWEQIETQTLNAKSNAMLNEAQAAYYWSEAARNRQSGNSQQDVPATDGTVTRPSENVSRASKLPINEVTRNDLGHIEAAVPPGWQLVETSNNRYLLMPAHKGFEQMGEVATLVMAIKENYKFWSKVYYQRYGVRPTREMLRYIEKSIRNRFSRAPMAPRGTMDPRVLSPQPISP